MADATRPALARHQGAPAGAGTMFVHFHFLRLNPKFHTLQSNEKLVARQEFLSAMEPLQRNMPLFCTYGLSGLRSDCDLLLWRGAQNLDSLHDTYERLGSYGLGKYLVPTASYLSTVDSMPQPSGTYLFIRIVMQTQEWQSLSLGQRDELHQEETKIVSKYPSLKRQIFQAFDVQGSEFVQTYETGAPADFFSLLQDIRNSKAGAYAAIDAPVYSCIRKDIRDIVDTLG